MLELQEKILSELIMIKWALIFIACSPFVIAGLMFLANSLRAAAKNTKMQREYARHENGSVDV